MQNALAFRRVNRHPGGKEDEWGAAGAPLHEGRMGTRAAAQWMQVLSARQVAFAARELRRHCIAKANVGKDLRAIERLKPISALVVDFDNTLVNGEGVLEIARWKKVLGEVREIPEAVMSGELRMEEAFGRAAGIVRPSEEEVWNLALHYGGKIAAGARETIEVLRAAGIEIFVVSSGYRQAIVPVARELGIEEGSVFANELVFGANGEYAGFDGESPLAKDGGKLEIIRMLRREGRIAGNAAIVGDGIIDMRTKAEGGVQAAIAYVEFARRESVVQAADAVAPSFGALLRILLTERQKKDILDSVKQASAPF